MVTSKVGRVGPLWRHATLLRLALHMVWWTPTISACWVPQWTWHLAFFRIPTIDWCTSPRPMCCLRSNREHRESLKIVSFTTTWFAGFQQDHQLDACICLQCEGTTTWFSSWATTATYSNPPFQFLGPSPTPQKVPEPRNVFGFLSKYDPSWAPNHIDDTARWPPNAFNLAAEFGSRDWKEVMPSYQFP